MWITAVLAGITLVILLVKSILHWVFQVRSHPPGPLPIPFYGNQMPKDVHPGLCSWYEQLRKEYGNIFTVFQGPKPTVVVNSFQAVNELLIDHGNLVHTRPSDTGILSFLHDNAGLVWNNNSYKSLRKISSLALKSFNLFHSTESPSSEKLSDLLDSLEDDNISDISAALRDTVSENICAMIFGLDNQKTFPEVMELHYGSLAVLNKADNFLRVPILKYLPGFRQSWTKSIKGKGDFKQFLKQVLQDHADNPTNDKFCDDFFDSFLRHNRTQKANQLEVQDCFATVMQLMLAGLDAVHGTLMWLCLYISINPYAQNKMAEEIKSQIGLTTHPTMKHMSAMPYCMAVIYETLRISNTAFTSLPYTNQQELTIQGTRIPAHASIIVNLVSINKDPETFPEPNKFKPERFIDKDGNLLNIPQFSPFSIGRRACLGESFSKSNIFITAVRLLQRYQLCTLNDEMYSTESIPAFLSTPAPYKLEFIPRTIEDDC